MANNGDFKSVSDDENTSDEPPLEGVPEQGVSPVTIEDEMRNAWKRVYPWKTL